MITTEHISKLVNEALGSETLFLVEVSVDRYNKIKVVLDSDETVSIADCISVNRSIEQNLDRDDEDFSLEVTSAGLGQPLKLIRQYNKHIGKELEITSCDGIKFLGELKNVNDEFLELLQEKKKLKKQVSTDNRILHKLALKNIKLAKAIITV